MNFTGVNTRNELKQLYNYITIEVEVIPNSRPIILSSNDLSALYPAHFPTNDSLKGVPKVDFTTTTN